MKRRVVERLRGAYRHQSLIIYRPSLSPSMPNHLSTHLTPLLQNKNHSTSKQKNNHPERDGEEKGKRVEKMRRTVRKGWKRGGWKRCGGVKMGCIMTPMPNHLSTHLSLFCYSSFDEWGRVGKVEVMRRDEKDG